METVGRGSGWLVGVEMQVSLSVCLTPGFFSGSRACFQLTPSQSSFSKWADNLKMTKLRTDKNYYLHVGLGVFLERELSKHVISLQLKNKHMIKIILTRKLEEACQVKSLLCKHEDCSPRTLSVILELGRWRQRVPRASSLDQVKQGAPD